MSPRNHKKQRVADSSASSDSVDIVSAPELLTFAGPDQPQIDIIESESESESDESESESESESETDDTEMDEAETETEPQTEILSPFDHKLKGVAIPNILDAFPHRWACILCGIDQKPKRLPQCEHCICDDCIMPFITDMIKNSAHGFKCPKNRCTVMWTVEHCRDYVPREVGDRWIQAIREARVLADPQYISCSFPTCGAPFVDDLRGFLIRACTSCWRIFCTSCKVDWHMGMSCSQYQALVRAADLLFS